MAITIDQAIKDLQARVDGELNIKGEDDCADMKLGIEALKHYRVLREAGVGGTGALLPGETKE